MISPHPAPGDEATSRNHTWAAFLYALPIIVLGGLVGLGGAEFRLPMLVGALGYSARRAVPLNLAISLVTLAVAFITRGRVLSWETLVPWMPASTTLLIGALITSFYAPALVEELRAPFVGMRPIFTTSFLTSAQHANHSVTLCASPAALTLDMSLQ